MASKNKEDAASAKPRMRMICPACNAMYDGEFVCKGCGAGLLEIPDAPLLSGQLLDGRYDVEGVIGTGGMGTVYRARQRGMEREVAIKVLHPHYAHQPRAVKRFFREAQAASKLVHPNIVTVYDFGRSIDGHLYMVMEMLEGWTLGDLIHYRAPLAAPLAISIARQICDALGEAHKHRIVHRDLKPDNVLITMSDDGLWAKVLDFGIARAMRDKDADLSVNHSTVEIAGTPAYMSPEQILGKEPDTRSDLYALGIILYEMLTKQRPFDDDSSVALCMKQLNDVPPPVSELAPSAKSLDAVVAALLEKRTQDRPTHASDVRTLLEACPDCHAPIAQVQIDTRNHRALGVKTTRADQALMMVQPTLEVNDTRGNSLSDVIGRVGQNTPDEPALSELSGLTFPRRTGAPLVDARPRPIKGRTAAPGSNVCLVAQLLVEHASVLTSGVVGAWLDNHRTAGWGIARDAQKAVLRIHGATKGDPTAVRKEAIASLVMLQREALDHNVALRVGAVAVDEPREIAAAIDLARRLAASSAHGRVALPRELQAALSLEATPQTHVFLPDGSSVDSVALGPNRRGDAEELLWGRSVPLRRLGQFADEARRSAKVVRGLVVGPRGIGKTALVRSFASGRRHLFVRVSPGARMWPGHTIAQLAAQAMGVSLTGSGADALSQLDLPQRAKDLLSLLLFDTPAESAPTPRMLARMVLDCLERYASDSALVIVIDDVHLMDGASITLLEAMLGAASDKPWCLVGTARWAKPDTFLSDAKRLDLRPLSMRAANAVLETLAVPPRQRHALMAAAHGNPLSLRLLGRAMANDQKPELGHAIQRLLPAILRAAPPEVADRAWVAAALGGPDAEDDAVHAARLYLETGLADELSAWLQRRLARLGPVAHAVAAAWRDAQAPDTTLRAERAERLGLWRVAAAEYEASLSLLEPDDRSHKQLRAAHVRARAGDVNGALLSYDASIRAGAVHHRPTALLGFASLLLEIGERDRAHRVLEGVKLAIDSAKEVRAAAELSALEARVQARRGNQERAMERLTVARDLTEQLKRTDARAARALEALTQEIRAEVAVLSGDSDAARLNLKQARDGFRDLGRDADALRCLVDLGFLELESNLASRAVDTFRAATRLAAAADFDRESLRADIGQGIALVAIGEVDEGMRHLRNGLKSARADGDTATFATASLGMAQAMIARGLFVDAMRYVERGVAACDTPRVLARALLIEGEAWAGQDQPRKAQRATERAAEVAQTTGDGLLIKKINGIRRVVARLGSSSSIPSVNAAAMSLAG